MSTSITVRPATLEDVPAIVAIHRSDIVTWKRYDAEGSVHLAQYAELSPYERWQNGGPWMDESLYALYLARTLRPGSGVLTLVAEVDGQVQAMAEAVLGEEPQPFGRNLNLSVIYTLRGHAGQGLGSALIRALLAEAEQAGCDTVLVGHAEAPDFYARHGFEPAAVWRRARLPAKMGQTQYSAQPFEPAGYDLARGWGMPVGRYQSARQEWERLQPGAEPDFAEWAGLRLERWRLEARRAPALLMLDEAPRERGVADVHLWLPPGASLSRQLLAAIRDRAARSGFHELMFFMDESSLPQLGLAWHDDGYKQRLFMRRMRGA